MRRPAQARFLLQPAWWRGSASLPRNCSRQTRMGSGRVPWRTALAGDHTSCRARSVCRAKDRDCSHHGRRPCAPAALLRRDRAEAELAFQARHCMSAALDPLSGSASLRLRTGNAKAIVRGSGRAAISSQEVRPSSLTGLRPAGATAERRETTPQSHKPHPKPFPPRPAFLPQIPSPLHQVRNG
jgi:hypothetical protein